MSAEPGHVPNRHYFDREGHLHLNGIDIYSADESPLPTTALSNIESGLSISGTAESTMSEVVLSADITVEAAAGTSDVGNSAYISAVQGNLVDNGDPLTKTHTYQAGVHGLYSSTTNSNASTYPKGAVLAGIGGGSNTADGAVIAYVDGDTTVTTARAAFKVKAINTDAASGFDFGLDLQDAAQSGISVAVDKDFYLKAPVRLVQDVVELVGDGAPTNAVTGADVAGPGSRYTDYTNANLYINANTKSSPTWKLVTRAA